MNHASACAPDTAVADIAPGMVRLLAFAAGLIVANLYYAQPLVGPIAAATGLSAGAAGLVVTLAQIGYALGLFFIVPLGDLVENRRLVFILLPGTALALAAAAFSEQAWLFFVGGAVGSAAGGWVYAQYGWDAVLLLGMALPGAALLYWVSEYVASTRTVREASGGA